MVLVVVGIINDGAGQDPSCNWMSNAGIKTFKPSWCLLMETGGAEH